MSNLPTNRRFGSQPRSPRDRSALWGLLLAAVLQPISAQPAHPTLEALQARIRALELELENLKQAVAAQAHPNSARPTATTNAATNAMASNSAEPAGPAPTNKPAQLSLEDVGLSFASGDGNLKLRLRGYIQADGRFYLDDTTHAATDTFLLNRVRPVFEGTVFKEYDFKLMPDFGQGRSVLQDGYIDARFLPEFSVRVGKFKGPVGLERLQSARDLYFVQRSLPTNLAPNRDIGVSLHGEVLAGRLGYELGVFNGVPDGGSDDTDENDAKDLAGRVFVEPFKLSGMKPLQGVGFGVAGTIGHEDGIAPAYHSAGQQTFFSFNSGVNAHGQRDRFSPQGYYYWGPFGLLGEYIASFEDVEKGAVRRQLHNSAWQLTASWVLTGEKASYTGIVPTRPFSPGKGQWGAFELAARVGQLNVDSDAFRNLGTAANRVTLADPAKSASEATQWGVGLNWYLNRDVKLMLDYDRTRFRGGAIQGNRPTEQALFTRLQLSF